jgi:uncharacterized repeat protein (TIGR04138 family)
MPRPRRAAACGCSSQAASAQPGRDGLCGVAPHRNKRHIASPDCFDPLRVGLGRASFFNRGWGKPGDGWYNHGLAGHPRRPRGALAERHTCGTALMAVEDLMTVVRQTRYPLDAFLFVQRGLDYTVRREHGELDAEPEELSYDDVQDRHVDGATLCYGLRDYAKQQYGLMARAVLKRWNIHRCEDFGHIVFAMVEAGLMHKTDNDTVDDFTEVFDLSAAFNDALELSDLHL